jgi:NRPS condensation-like uncharacterized protein
MRQPATALDAQYWIRQPAVAYDLAIPEHKAQLMTTRASWHHAAGVVHPAFTAFSAADEMASYLDSPAEPNNVHLEVWLPGRLDPARLREAVSAVAATHPRAAARLAAGSSWRRGFAWESAAPDRDPVSVMSWRTAAELDSGRGRFLAASPPLDQSPPFRLLVASGPAADQEILILNAHHAAFDGHSCVRLLDLIARQYGASPDGASAGQYRVRAQPPAVTDPAAGRAGASSTAARLSIRPPERIAGQGPAGRLPGHGFALVAWPDVPTPAKPGTGTRATVNDLLIAALIEAISRWNATRGHRKGPIRITMPANVRLPGHQGDLGNFSRLWTITADPRAGQLLTTVAAQTAAAKSAVHSAQADPSSVRALLPVTVKRQLVRMALRVLGPLRSNTALISNLGNVTDPPVFGSLAPTRLWFSPSVHMPGGLSVGVITVAGRLQICVRYRYALLDDPAGAEFAAGYAAALHEMSAG